MRFRTKLAWLILASVLISSSGCGGGSSTTGTLTLGVSPTQIALKSTVTAVAVYANPNSPSAAHMNINFTTNHPELFNPTSADTDSSGQATAILTPKALTAATGPTGPVEIIVTASVGDLIKTAKFTLKPAYMTITPPPDKSFSVGAIPTGGVVRYIPSGIFVKVVDGNGNPVPQSTPVTISVDNIVNGTPGEVLFWNDYPNGTASAPPFSFTKTTDYLGQIPMQVTIDIIVPSSKSQTISVLWRVTTTDPDSGATIIGYAITMLSVTP